MKYYEQCDTRWGSNNLGYCTDSFCTSGCYCTSLAMLDGRTPPEVNDILKQSGYADGCMIVDSIAAQSLGLIYNGISYDMPDYPTIAETDHFAGVGIPQHFFVIFPDGTINDPLGGERVDNRYHITKYHLFKSKEESEDYMTEEQVKEMTKRLRHDILGQDEDEKTIQGDMDYITSNKSDKYVLSNWTGDRTKEAYDTYIMKKSDCNASDEKARADNLQVELGNTLTRTENEISELKKQLKETNTKLDDSQNKLTQAQTKLSNCGKTETVEVEKDYTLGELIKKVIDKLLNK